MPFHPLVTTMLSDQADHAIHLLCDVAEEKYGTDNDEWAAIRNKAKDILEEEGFEYIDTGTYRLVYKTPDGESVIKIAKNMKTGVLENQSSVENWFDAKDAGVTERLATLYEYDDEYRWILQEYVNNTSPDDTRIELLKDDLQQHSVHISEIDHWNTGKRSDGTAVLLDYGGM